MFTLPHLIWLLVLGILIALSLILLKRYKPSHLLVSRCVMALLIVFKLFHLALSMKQSVHGGMVLNQTQLSFHLCSIQIYLVILIHLIKNENTVKTLKSFMVPCMVIGATMSLLIPTEGVSVAHPRVWQYMLIHGVLIFYGLYLMLLEKVDLSFKAYVKNLGLLLIIVVMAFVMNSVLEQYKTNFLFLREPPMENLPVLNLDHGWFVYMGVLAAIAVALVTAVHLPFMIRKRKKEQAL